LRDAGVREKQEVQRGTFVNAGNVYKKHGPPKEDYIKQPEGRFLREGKKGRPFLRL